MLISPIPMKSQMNSPGCVVHRGRCPGVRHWCSVEAVVAKKVMGYPAVNCPMDVENPWKSTISIDSNGFHRENARFLVISSIVLRKPSPHRYNVGDRLSTAFHGALGFSAQRYPVRIFAIRPYALVISSTTGSFPWCVDFPEKNETSMARMGISWPVVMTPEVGFPSGYRRGYSVRWHEHDQAWVNSINFSSIAHVCQWAMKTTFDWLMQGIIL